MLSTHDFPFKDKEKKENQKGIKLKLYAKSPLEKHQGFSRERGYQGWMAFILLF